MGLGNACSEEDEEKDQDFFHGIVSQVKIIALIAAIRKAKLQEWSKRIMNMNVELVHIGRIFK